MRSWDGIEVNVGEFTEASEMESPTCNYKGPIETIDGENYAEFIRKAFVSELKFAGKYEASAPLTISGRLDRIENSTVTGTDWTITMTFWMSNGRSISLTEHYNYHGSVVGTVDSTCGASAAAFVPAVQNLIGKLVAQIPQFAK